MKDINDIELFIGDSVLYYKWGTKYSTPATIKKIDETHYINREHVTEYAPVLITISNRSVWVHNSQLEKVKLDGFL